MTSFKPRLLTAAVIAATSIFMSPVPVLAASAGSPPSQPPIHKPAIQKTWQAPTSPRRSDTTAALVTSL
ncbi:MAG: hypothetical protein ACJ762_16775 [Solirubrobacteraceae bacterium]